MQRHIDELPDSAHVTRPQRCQDANYGEQAACHIRHRGREAHGRAVDLAGQRHRARFRLRYQVITGLSRPRPAPPIAADRGVNQSRIQFRKGLITDTGALQGRRRCQVGHEDIGVLHQLVHEFSPAVGSYIQGDAALVAVDRKVIAALIADIRWRPLPRIVADARPFDLDHISAEIAQYHCAVGTGQRLRLIHHLDSAQRRIFAHRFLVFRRTEAVTSLEITIFRLSLAVSLCRAAPPLLLVPMAPNHQRSQQQEQTPQAEDHAPAAQLHQAADAKTSHAAEKRRHHVDSPGCR